MGNDEGVTAGGRLPRAPQAASPPLVLSRRHQASSAAEARKAPGAEASAGFLHGDRLYFHAHFSQAPLIMCYSAPMPSPSSQYGMDIFHAIKWCLIKEIMKNGSPRQISLAILLL